MTQIEHQPAPDGGGLPPAAPSSYRAAAIALAVALLVVAGLVATAPFWAPHLPWSRRAPAADKALVARLDRLVAAQQQARQQAEQDAAANAAGLQRLERRAAALEARPGPPSAAIDDIRAQLARLSGTAAELTARVATLDKAVQARAATAAGTTTDTAIALVLLQIRSAVAAGRPFPAEYQALTALAHDRPELATAAAPLAEPAKAGVASRAVLAKGLRDLAAAPAAGASASSRSAPHGWGEAALARLHGLVTVRRVDDAAPPQRAAAAPVNAAELALAGGDLAGAVGAIEKAPAEGSGAAAKWLRMARRRLAVETALQRLEAQLTARLGQAAPGSGG